MSEYDLNNPQSDVESYLANMDGILAPLPLPPESNVEKYLAHIVGVQGVELPNKPDSRVEAYLEKLALDPPQPVTPILIEKQITNNGVYSASDDSADGYSKVTVEVPDPVLDELVATVNGEYNPTHDGYSKVTVQVPDPALETLSVTENGEYTPTAYGYSRVTVSVQPPANSYQLKSITTPTSLATFEASAMPMPSLKASIKAQQDLHGYDKPWVGGAGKNKINPEDLSNTSAVTRVIDGDKITITADGSGTYQSSGIGNANNLKFPAGTYYVKVNCISIQNPNVFCTLGFRNSSNSFISDVITLSAGQLSKTIVINEPCYFSIVVNGTEPNRANQVVIKNLIASNVDVPFEPYSNECPISGWDEANISDVGKNFWDLFTSVNGYINQDGNVAPVSSASFKASDYIRIKPNVTYTVSYNRPQSASSDENGIRIAWYDKNKTFIRRDGTLEETATAGIKSYTGTAPSNAYYARVSSYCISNSTDNQLEIGTSATAFEPYNPDSYTTTISLGQTVYGGEVDVVNGGATDNFIIETFDGSNDEVWEKDASHCYSVKLNGALQAWKSDVECVSNEFEYKGTVSGATYMSNAGLYLWYNPNMQEPSTRYAMIRNNEMSLAKLKAYLAEHPLQVCYELATPTTLTTQPTPIKSLNGTNNLSVDCGEILEGEYLKAL